MSTNLDAMAHRVSASHTPGADTRDPSTIMKLLDASHAESWILILDNADTSSLDILAFATQLSQSVKGCVLLTTCNRQFAFDMAHSSSVIEMPVLGISDATLLLSLHVAQTSEDKDDDHTDLVEYLGRHPSAIVRASAYMRIISTSCSALLSLLQNDPTMLQYILGLGSLDSTFGSSNHQVPYIPAGVSQDTKAIELLSVFACLDHSHLDHHLLSRIANTTETKQSLTVLKSYYLLNPTQSSNARQINVLAAKIVRSLLPSDSQRNHIVASALRIAASSLTIDHDDRQCQPSHQDFKHASCALMTLVSFTGEMDAQPGVTALAVAVATKVCQHLITIGQASKAVMLVQQLLSWGRTTITILIQANSKLQSKLGAAYHSHGLFAQAISITQTALCAQCRIDENRIDTLHSLNNMGVVYQDQGRYSMAESYHSKALEMKQRIFGGQHPETYTTLNNLALVLQSQKRFDEAEKLHRRAFRGRKRLLPSTHPDIFVSMSNFGVLLLLQGRLGESQKLHEAALTGRECVLGPDHPETTKSKGNVALLLERQGQPDRAIAMFREVCQTYKHTLGFSHPDVIRSLRNLAIFLHRQGELPEAEALIREVLDAQEEKFGKGHSETFGTLQYLATLLHKQGKLEDAVDIIAWLYDMRNEVMGRDHPDTTCSRAYSEELEAELSLSGQGSIVSFTSVI
jgi:tetratricopeptide (TPR) repeat protein